MDWKLERIVVPVSDDGRERGLPLRVRPAGAGADPERAPYNSFPSFSDPDGNGWTVQEVPRATSPA